MNVLPWSYRRSLFPLLLVFFLTLAGCMGGAGGGGSTGLQDKQSATVTAGASASSVTQGQSVTLEAYVNPSLATGTVTFYDGSNAIGTAAISSSGLSTVGIALLETTFSSIGQQTITAQYSGSAFYSASTSAPVTIGVYSSNLASTSLTLQASTTTPQYQTSVTLTATVSPSSATGTVTFYNGSTSIGSAAVNAGTATLTTSFAAGGAATLHAVYSGDYNYLSSNSNSLTMNVSGPLVTSTALQVSASSTAIGDNVTLTANLIPATATGTVTFYNGSSSIGTANVNAGVATLIYTFATSGTPQLKATFAGNASWQSSTSNQVTIFVTGTLPDTIALTVSPSSIVIGYSATLTATITPPVSGGSVTFYDGSVSLGSYTPTAGTVGLSQQFMSPGPQSITAAFSGNLDYLASTSNAVTLNVSPPGPTPTTTALALSETSGYDGDYVTLTATVAPAAATGQVNFYDNGTYLGNAAISSGKAAWSQIFNQDGDNEITAVYQGDVTYSSSTSAAQDLVLSEPSSPSPTCPGDPSCPGDDPCEDNPAIYCGTAQCTGDPYCPVVDDCSTDPALCPIECPGDPSCPPDFSDSSLLLRPRLNLFGPAKIRGPVLKCVAFRKRGC